MLLRLVVLFALGVAASSVQAFCGFYVAKADGALYNQASKVVFVRDGVKSVITMSSDYRGEAKDFAMIVPTPHVLAQEDVKTVEAKIVTHLDRYTAPRLVQYHDNDPCAPMMMAEMLRSSKSAGNIQFSAAAKDRAKALGVTIAAEYAVGSYDIQILDAQRSNGLTQFLLQEGYKLPLGAEKVLAGYIEMGMKFFVAKVNLARHQNEAVKELPPLQISFRSEHFMLPLQLGKLNADKAQDAIFLMLSKQGRVYLDNYPNQDILTDLEVPSFVENSFGDYYRSLFSRQLADGGIATEYAWDMAWCDPCAADPLSDDELRALGVNWIDPPTTKAEKRRIAPQAKPVFVTRLHAQYNRQQLPHDPMFIESNDRENFQGRYVMNQPFEGELNCEAAEQYVANTRRRINDEAHALARATGWSIDEINQRIDATVAPRYR